MIVALSPQLFLNFIVYFHLIYIISYIIKFPVETQLYLITPHLHYIINYHLDISDNIFNKGMKT